jgi:hypothetical protein
VAADRALDAKVRQATRLFEAFTGADADAVERVHVRDIADDVLVVVGKVDAIAYSTRRGGKRESYQHEFKSSSRPVLATSHDGRRLYLLAGAFRFTSRGIEDR